jgi:hypothetical protein|tara:strand:+ start:494 stop:817 length:324 start_codon:yes stop_codon:yes gene_type:complete
MSPTLLSFILCWIVAVSFGIGYPWGKNNNKIIMLLLLLSSLYCFIYGIYIFSSWGDYVQNRSQEWLIENPTAKSVPTKFLLIPLYPYLLMFFGIFGFLFHSKVLKRS